MEITHNMDENKLELYYSCLDLKQKIGEIELLLIFNSPNTIDVLSEPIIETKLDDFKSKIKKIITTF